MKVQEAPVVGIAFGSFFAGLTLSDWASIVAIAYTVFLFVLKIRDEFFPQRKVQ